MTDDQVRQAEEAVMEIISKAPPVYAQEAPLPLAKEVQGLRACFDEVRKGCGQIPFSVCTVFGVQWMEPLIDTTSNGHFGTCHNY